MTVSRLPAARVVIGTPATTAALPPQSVDRCGTDVSRLPTLFESYRPAVILAASPGLLLPSTGGIMLVYLASMLLGLFGHTLPFIHDNGIVGILFSLFVVGVAAMNLVLDFDLIESAARCGAPKYMEWYGAFALMVTLIWLYIEMLRLLSKLRSRR
jgi:uncharacterized YccA/Bax inhibitor family protein